MMWNFEVPDIEGNPASDTALFDVELISPLPYSPIGDGIIPIQATLSGSFELSELVATVAVEGISGTLPLSLALDGTPTFEGEVDLRGVYEGDLVFPLVTVTVTDLTGASAQVSTRIFVDRTEVLSLNASPSSITAGDEVIVNCSLSVGGEVSDEELSLEIVPSAAAVNRVGAGRWFVRLESQPHRFRCETLDGISRSNDTWIDVDAAFIEFTRDECGYKFESCG